MRLFLRDFPTMLSLSVSSVCNAKCIWCPIGLKLNSGNKSKFLSTSIVDRLVEQCRGKPPVDVFLADMGEPLMNPDFKEIVTKCRTINLSGLHLSSNFSLMNEDMSRFILDNNFTGVGLNIDGATENGYAAVKHLPLNLILDNLVRFVRLRQEKMDKSPGWMPTKICVNITTQSRYYFEIGEPWRITVPDETRMAYQLVRKIIEPIYDYVNPSFVITWAERKRWNKPRDKDNSICTNLWSLGAKCCIDTDGNVIACCQDYDSELKFGNVMEEELTKIWCGEKRQKFIERMTKNDYEGVGPPCSMCQD